MVKEVIISVKTGEAVKNIQELKENIKVYKASLNQLEFGSAQYQDRLKEITAAQQMLRDAMHATNTSFSDLSAAVSENTVQFDKNNQIVTMEGVSYNALVNTLHDLKEAWRGTTDEQKRANLGDQINAVNNQLKKMDASVGVYSRNVGSYANITQQLGDALGGLGGIFPGVTRGARTLKGGLDLLGKTPVIAILGFLVGILDSVIKAFKQTEEGSQALEASFAPLKAIGDLLTVALQAVGKVVAGLIQGFMKLTTAIFGTNKATQQRIELAEKERKLTEQNRKNIVENAKAERDVAELRAKATEKDVYTAEQRLSFLQQAGEKEKEIAARALADAKLQYEIIHAKNQLTKSSTEELDKEAQAYAALIKAETDYYNQVRTINTSIQRTRREIAKEEKEQQTARLQPLR